MRVFSFLFLAASLMAADSTTEVETGEVVVHKDFAMLSVKQKIPHTANYSITAKLFRVLKPEPETEPLERKGFLRFGTLGVEITKKLESTNGAHVVSFGTGVTATNHGHIGPSGSIGGESKYKRLEASTNILFANLRDGRNSQTALIAEPLGELCITFGKSFCGGVEIDAFAFNSKALFGAGPEIKFRKWNTEVGLAVLRNSEKENKIKFFLNLTRKR